MLTVAARQTDTCTHTQTCSLQYFVTAAAGEVQKKKLIECDIKTFVREDVVVSKYVNVVAM